MGIKHTYEQKKNSSGKELLKKIRLEQNRRAEIQLRHQRDREPNLLDISQALDEYYFLEKLRTYCSYLSYRIIVNDALVSYSEKDFRLLPSILVIVRAGTSWHPAVNIYFHISQLLDLAVPEAQSSNIGIDVFTAIEKQLQDHEADLSYADLMEIHSHLTNYAAYQINHGREDFLLKNILHHQRLIDLHELSRAPYVINAGVYKNMVSLILRTEGSGDPELGNWLQRHHHKDIWTWAHHFIERYREQLPESAKEKYYPYCKALVYFRSGAFYEAFELIRELDRVRELFINFDIKVLRLQLLIELDLLDDRFLEKREIKMEQEIETLRSMLKYDKNQNPKLAYQVDYFQDFLNLYRKWYSFYSKNAWMFHYGDEKYHQQRAALKAEIQRSEYPYRQWFLDKLDAIK